MQLLQARFSALSRIGACALRPMQRSPEAGNDDPCVEDYVAGDVNEALVAERPQDAQQLATDDAADARKSQPERPTRG